MNLLENKNNKTGEYILKTKIGIKILIVPHCLQKRAFLGELNQNIPNFWE